MTDQNDIPNQDMFPEDKISRLEGENLVLKITADHQRKNIVKLQKFYSFAFDMVREISKEGSLEICADDNCFDYLTDILHEYDNGDDLREKYKGEEK